MCHSHNYSKVREEMNKSKLLISLPRNPYTGKVVPPAWRLRRRGSLHSSCPHKDITNSGLQAGLWLWGVKSDRIGATAPQRYSVFSFQFLYSYIVCSASNWQLLRYLVPWFRLQILSWAFICLFSYSYEPEQLSCNMTSKHPARNWLSVGVSVEIH